MRLIGGYEIRGRNIRKRTIGSVDKPYLYSITAGQRNQRSLIFHIKIEDDFHQCHLRRVNATYCNFVCVNQNCPATHKMTVDPRFVTCTPNFHKLKNGRTRHKYAVNVCDPEIRDVTNWTVVDHKSLHHDLQ